MKSKSTLRHFLAITGSSLVAVSSASATTYYWDNNSTTSGFGTASGTWGTDAFLTTDSTGVFGVAGITSPTTADALNFGNGATVLATGTVNVTGSVGNTATFPNANLTVNGILEMGNNTLSFIKTGTGTQTLSGTTNNYTGTTTVLQGVLNTTQASALAGYTTLATVVINGGTLGVCHGIRAFVFHSRELPKCRCNLHVNAGCINPINTATF